MTKKEDYFVKEAAHINNKAVTKMRMAVDSQSAVSIETLAASICLYLYEVGLNVDECGQGRRI